MRYYFHEDAEAEFDRAVEYYEDSRLGLGLEFAQEVYAAITRISAGISGRRTELFMENRHLPIFHKNIFSVRSVSRTREASGR